ncbi:GcvT family protein [Pseudonocardia lacus]|uniref:GcvT family protein n=1 Tax=Pseudonocardia lacus TaxID=2835865 RepID=UPI001BDDBE54|nr:FAD-dependent oxidoreductase [Pseudonocardia lacus]
MTGPRVVVIGAGVVGAAVGDELTARGWTDVTVLDRGELPLPGGSSSHAPGLVFQTNPSKTMAGFARYTVEKLSALELDGQPCFNRVGGLEVATTPERMGELARRHGLATSWGIGSRLVDPEECAALHPLLPASSVLGGFHIPTDGLAAAPRAVAAQLARAQERGATVRGGVRVLDVSTAGGRVTGVVTDQGEVAADVVVSATGFWGPRTGALVGLTIPLLPMAHQYARTGPLAELAGRNPGTTNPFDASAPILRHQDRDLYFREHGDRVGIGSYAHDPIPVSLDRLGADPMPSVLDFTPDDFAPSWSDAVELLPALAATGVESGINGIFSFTPDGNPLIGEHPGLSGFWVAEAVWVTHSAGVGRALAHWLTAGEPDVDLHECDLNRFEPVQLTPTNVAARSTRNFVEVYDILHPLDPPEVQRPLRTSPFHARQVELGAVFDQSATGWERPRWFAANAELPEVDKIPTRGAWAARHWSPIAGAEALVTRDRVAMYDMTPLKRLEVTGPGALDLLDGLTSNNLRKKVGSVSYTLLLEPSGGVRSDLTVARFGEQTFQVGANSNLDLDALLRAAGPGVHITDVTGGTCCIGLWGPKAREVLAAVTTDDIGFGYFQARELDVAGVPVRALRVSYVGEMGWELYASAELGLRLWDVLWDAGRRHGVIAAGRSAFDSLRLEKGYRSAGADMTTEHDPYEAGLGFAVRPGSYPGADALDAERAPARRLVPLLLSDRNQVVMGKEPVFHDGTAVGYVTSAAYGYSIDASIAYAWLPAAAAEAGTGVQVEYFGERLDAVVATEPLYDAERKKLRG